MSDDEPGQGSPDQQRYRDSECLDISEDEIAASVQSVLYEVLLWIVNQETDKL